MKQIEMFVIIEMDSALTLEMVRTNASGGDKIKGDYF
jgi:hypothetical protein